MKIPKEWVVVDVNWMKQSKQQKRGIYIYSRTTEEIRKHQKPRKKQGSRRRRGSRRRSVIQYNIIKLNNNK